MKIGKAKCGVCKEWDHSIMFIDEEMFAKENVCVKCMKRAVKLIEGICTQ